MSRNLLILIIGIILLNACSDGETEMELSELKTEFEHLKTQLNSCSAELTQIKYTA